MNYKLIQGDCLDILPTLAADSVDAIVTDPPYGIAFMGKAWDKGVPAVAIWRECFRVLKPGGYLLSFAGTRTQHRMATNIEDAGFEIRDMIGWMYGSGFPKSHNISKAIDKAAIVDCTECKNGVIMRRDGTFVGLCKNHRADEGGVWVDASGGVCADCGGDFVEVKEQTFPSPCPHCDGSGKVRGVEREVVGVAGKSGSTRSAMAGDFAGGEYMATAPATPAAIQWSGWGTALKPAFEPITVARKPLSEKTVAANVLKHGTGGINVDGCRVGTEGARNNGSHAAPDGYSKNDIYGKFKPMRRQDYGKGRFPANICHDGSEEVMALFPESKPPWGKGKSISKSKSWKQSSSVRHVDNSKYQDEDHSAARFFYCAKASKADRDAGLDGFAEKRQDETDYVRAGTTNPRNRSQMMRRNPHPTVKPTALMRYLCRLVTPPNGTVLDPFNGSGSTGRGAVLEGFDYIGIELDAGHIAISEARINEALTTAKNKAGDFTPTAKEKASGQMNLWEVMQ